MITRNDIERDIDTSQSCATWTYKGKGCGIDPVDGHYVMWYGYGQQPDLVAKDWNADKVKYISQIQFHKK